MNQELLPRNAGILVGRSAPSHSKRLRPLPLPLRCVTWLVIVTQLLLPYSNIEVSAALPAAQLAQSVNTLTASAPEAAPNRAVPKVQPPPQMPAFSESPSDDEFFRARVFSEPLVPVGGSSTQTDNRGLADAIRAFLSRTDYEDVSAIVTYLDAYPESVWRVSLLANLGMFYRKTGYFSKALSSWAKAWSLSKGQAEPKAAAIADFAIGELLGLNARLGRYEQIELLLLEIQGRNIRGSATEKVTAAKEGLWEMRNRPEEAFRCGPYALERIRAIENPTSRIHEKITACKSTTNGISLSTLRSLASEIGMNYRMARRSAGSPVLVPSVIHWRESHYAALTKQNNGSFLVQDPTFGDEIWVTQQAIDAESSGYFLIPDQTLPVGWQSVSEAEAAQVWGKGSTAASDPDGTGCPDSSTDSCGGCGSGGAGGPPPGGCGGGGGFGGGPAGGGFGGGKAGMARYRFHTMVISLNIIDTPVGYRPSRGHGVEFSVMYSQREANQPSSFAYSNLGPKWTFDWLAYIKDDPANTNADKHYYMPGGGGQTYKYDSTYNVFRNLTADRSIVVMTATNAYERQLPDGSKQIFDLSDGATTNPRKIFLTKLLDPSSNAVTLTYNSNFCIVAIQDAIGLVTTVSYEHTNDVRKITKVTDPFGRYATFDYNTNGQLSRITDTIGVTSEFTYGTGDFITALTTPYGTTTFSYGETNRNRWLEATDPLGQKERLEYQNTQNTQLSNAESVAPSGYYNSLLQYRNSYYWDKTAYAHTNDTTKARIYHWLKTGMNWSSRILENEKKPLERRVFYSYANQPDGLHEGDSGQRTSKARVLDDGSTQKYQYEYNAFGKPTKVTDPTNRVTLFTYATNLVDLLEVRQQVGSTNELLATFTYNSGHQPLTAVDAAGQTNHFGYNAYGQLTAITNALNETTTLFYNSNGYITNITRAVSGATTTFAYDGTNRVRAVTDSQGYSVTFDYDIADRPVKTTYPDGTFEQIVYKWLDPILRKDRRGHWTQFVYDPLQRITDVQDALNRVTHFEWCGCGSLESITDPLGRVTRWERDLQGRVTTKVYADDTRITYAYEGAISRIKSMTDAKNQATLYDYYIDNKPKKVSFSNVVVSTPSVTFTYHTNYNRMLSMIDGVGTNVYSYYAVSNTVIGAGRLQSIDGPMDNDTITYTYDKLGRVESRAVNDVAERVTFDSLGRIAVVTNVIGCLTNFYIDNTPRLASNGFANGPRTVLSYFGNTNDQRLETLWHKQSDGSTIGKFIYAYDSDGHITNWTQQAGSDTPRLWIAEYDVVHQLLGVTVRSNGMAGAILNRYVYAHDKAGNRTSEQIDLGVSTQTHNDLNQVTTLAVSTGPVRVRGSLNEVGTVTVSGVSATFDTRNSNFVAYAQMTVGTNVVPVIATDYSSNRATNHYQLAVTNNGFTKSLSFDLNGNLTNCVTATGTNSYEWDAANRLTAIEVRQVGRAIKRSEFAYDGLSRRVRILDQTNGVTQTDHRYVWCNMGLCEKRDATGSAVNARYFAGGEQIGGTNYILVRDHLGSVREVLDTSGTVLTRYEYDPYGRRKVVSGNLHSDRGFTGHYLHSASGLHLAPFRALDSEIGRWTSRDPVGETGGLNSYAYVFDSPLSLSDPSGLFVGEFFDNISFFNHEGAFFNIATSIGEALGGVLAGNWDQVAEAYDSGPLGQTECYETANMMVQVSLFTSGMFTIGAIGAAATPYVSSWLSAPMSSLPGAATNAEFLMFLPLAPAYFGSIAWDLGNLWAINNQFVFGIGSGLASTGIEVLSGEQHSNPPADWSNLGSLIGEWIGELFCP